MLLLGHKNGGWRIQSFQNILAVIKILSCFFLRDAVPSELSTWFGYIACGVMFAGV
jgi:hypothetical protein